MNYKSEKIHIIGEAQRSRPVTLQLAAGRFHSKGLFLEINEKIIQERWMAILSIL